MSQPQNPQLDPLLDRVAPNPVGLDLIQVQNTAGGGAIIWRLNQFQSPWYVGFQDPTFIPGELPLNLYLNLSSGAIWYLAFDFIWTLVPSGGGGGGSSTVQTLSTTSGTITGAFNSSNTAFILQSAPDTPTDLLLFLNGIYQVQGVDYTILGPDVTMTVAPIAGGQLVAVIDVASVSLVQTLSSVSGTITGSINGSNTVFSTAISPTATVNTVLFLNGTYQLQGIDYSMTGSTITMTIAPVTGDQLVAVLSTSGSGGGGGSFSAITSGTNSQATMNVGSGASLQPVGTGIVNANEINGVIVTGSPTSGQVLTATGSTTAIWEANNATSLPWFDIKNYGGKPRASGLAVTTATTGTNSPNVNLGSIEDYQIGNGLVIYGVGTTVTSGSNPNFLNPPNWAPVATPLQVPALQGSTTFNYAIIGVDTAGALSPVSLPVTTTVGPNNFNSINGIILSAISSGGTLTIIITGNYPVAPGQNIMVSGFTGAGIPFNGIWNVNTVVTVTNTTITITGTGLADALGPINTFQTVRLTNIQQLMSLSRTGSTLTAVTAGTSGIQAGTSGLPVIGIVSGCTPTNEFLGWYTVTGVNAGTNTVTMASNRTISGTETATLGNQAFLTVFEYVQINLPPVVGTGALSYYIYADYNNTGNYVLIGKSLPKQQVFFDYGAYICGGFHAPVYVPTTLTSSSGVNPTFLGQFNQMYSGTIQSISGTAITVSPNVPNAATSAACMGDDAVCLRLAASAAQAAGGGYIFLSPSLTNSTEFYHFTSPTTLPLQVGVQQGAGINMSETITLQSSTWVSAPGSQGSVTPQFSSRNYSQIMGIASPMMSVVQSVYLDGLCFRDSAFGSNGQTAVFSQAYYFKMHECSFQFTKAASVPLVYCGQGGATCSITDCDFSVSGIVGNTYLLGQPPYSPHNLPAVWIRGQDNGTGGEPLNIFVMDGNNSFAGRGILLDSTNFAGTSSNNNYKFNCYENQQPVQPFLMAVGNNGFFAVTVENVVMDSSTINAVANWTSNSSLWVLDTITQSNDNFPLITGNIVTGLIGRNNNSAVGQNTNLVTSSSALIAPVPMFQPTDYGLIQQDAAVQIQNVGSVYGVIPPPVITSVTTSTTGGTIAAGTYFIYVTVKGWNGGEGCWSTVSSISTSGSSSTITVNWTDVTGGQGYYVYAGTSVSGVNKVQSSAVVGTSLTFTTIANNGDSPTIGLDGTGIPLIDAGSQVASPLFRAATGHFGNAITAPTLTGNRTTVLADGAGSVTVSGTLTTTASATDTIAIQGVTASSHVTITEMNSVAATMRASGNTWVSNITTNSVTLTHPATSGAIFHIVCTVN